MVLNKVATIAWSMNFAIQLARRVAQNTIPQLVICVQQLRPHWFMML